MPIRIISWNVNGIRAAERKGFLPWLGGCGADIVCVQETKCRPEQLGPTLLSPGDYRAEWCAAAIPGYSGVATFSRLPARAVRRGVGEERFDREGRALISEFADFTLFNIYFPSGNRGPEWVAHKLAFYERFLALALAEIAAGRSVVVAGDINTAYAEIDLARPRENRRTSGFLAEEREALGRFFAAGLVDSFRHLRPAEAKYSWWSQRAGGNARERNVGWRLDYILVSRDLAGRIVAADTHPEVAGSDHCPVSLVLDLDGQQAGTAPAPH